MQNLKLFFLEREFEERHPLYRAKMYTVYPGKCLFWHYRLLLFFVYKTVSRISFNLFRREIKGFIRFHEKWCWFHGHDVRFSKSLGSELKFEKTETRFCRWEQWLQWQYLPGTGKPFYLFCLQKKIPENAYL